MALNKETWCDVLRYENGILFWKIRPSNNTHVGDVAGKIGGHGYRHVGFKHKRYPAHRVVWIMHFGDIPAGFEIDHINHIRSDNNIGNLRLIKRADNNKNKSLAKNNTSGVVGVHWSKPCRKWQVQITINGLHRHIGVFDSLEEAITARKNAEIKAGFHKNHGTDACL